MLCSFFLARRTNGTALSCRQPRACRLPWLMLPLLGLLWPGLSFSQWDGAKSADSVDLELGLLRFTRNDVRIPGDSGTRFPLDELTGSSGTSARLHATWWWNERNALRLTLAPLSASGTGLLDQETDFAGERFAPGQPTRGDYRFNTYRLTWRYRFHSSERWDWGAGVAVLVRDARIRLTQGTLRASDDDLGFVPVLHAHGRYRLSDRTTLVMDVEGAWAPQGRAFDIGLRAERDFVNGWYGHLGLRTLEGGADNSDVYTFAWVHFATMGLGYRF